MGASGRPVMGSARPNWIYPFTPGNGIKNFSPLHPESRPHFWWRWSVRTPARWQQSWRILSRCLTFCASIVPKPRMPPHVCGKTFYALANKARQASISWAFEGSCADGSPMLRLPPPKACFVWANPLPAQKPNQSNLLDLKDAAPRIGQQRLA